MATLKDLSRRLRSITSIQKITKSMKMVAASKFSRAEREFRAAKVFGEGAISFYTRTGLFEKVGEPFAAAGISNNKKRYCILMSSDRGLCGGIHAGIGRMIRNKFQQLPGQEQINDFVVNEQDTKLLVIGDKVKAMLQRQFSQTFTATVSEVGKRALTFDEASQIAHIILDDPTFAEADTEIIYNKFNSVLSYQIRSVPVMSAEKMRTSTALGVYDSVDSEVLRSFHEFNLAALVYYAFKQNHTCELASRMNAMEGASKNAGELIDALRLKYNRTRQFVITRELIEIISGASALESTNT